jgi:nicotinamidase/pyrazinamidase
MNRQSALLVVDVQIDFCMGGSLAVPASDAIIPVINRYIEIFRSVGVPVFATRDWHPPVTRHFREFGGLWPPHCVAGSAGARFHPGLKLPEDVVVVSKGMNPDRDDYSTFQAALESGEPLRDHLADMGVTKLYICGLATDYCVRETSLDALKAGLSVIVLADAVKGVDIHAGDSDRALAEIARLGGKIADMAAIEEEFRVYRVTRND